MNTFLLPTILHTPVQKDVTGYLVLIYSSSGSSEEIFRSSVEHLITFSSFPVYLHYCKIICG